MEVDIPLSTSTLFLQLDFPSPRAPRAGRVWQRCVVLRVRAPLRQQPVPRRHRLRFPAVLPPRIGMSFLRRKRAGSRAQGGEGHLRADAHF